MVDLVEAASKPTNTGGSCWALQLDDELAEQLEEVRQMVDRGEPVSFANVRRALGEAGVKLGKTSVPRHLRRECACE